MPNIYTQTQYQEKILATCLEGWTKRACLRCRGLFHGPDKSGSRIRLGHSSLCLGSVSTEYQAETEAARSGGVVATTNTLSGGPFNSQRTKNGDWEICGKTGALASQTLPGASGCFPCFIFVGIAWKCIRVSNQLLCFLVIHHLRFAEYVNPLKWPSAWPHLVYRYIHAYSGP